MAREGEGEGKRKGRGTGKAGQQQTSFFPLVH